MKKEIRLSKPFRHPDKFPTRTSETYKLTEEDNKITSVKKMEGDGKYVEQAELEEKTVTSNGVVLPSSGKVGMSKVTVNVPTGESIGVVTLNGGLPSTYPDEWNTTEPFSDPKPCKYLYNDTYHYGQLCYSPLRGGIQTLHLFTPDQVDRFTRSVAGAVGGWDPASPWQ